MHQQISKLFKEKLCFRKSEKYFEVFASTIASMLSFIITFLRKILKAEMSFQSFNALTTF